MLGTDINLVLNNCSCVHIRYELIEIHVNNERDRQLIKYMGEMDVEVNYFNIIRYFCTVDQPSEVKKMNKMNNIIFPSD